MTVRNYIDNAPTTNVPAGLNGTDVTATVGSLVGWPTSFPYTATFDMGTATAEVVLVTNAAANVITMTRNYDGQGAFSHLSTGTFNHTAVSKDFIEANGHINAGTNVHGVVGQVVGTTDAQTLSGKTLTGPVINGGSQVSPTITTPTIASPTITGTGTIAAASVATSAGVTAAGSVTGLELLAIPTAPGPTIVSSNVGNTQTMFSVDDTGLVTGHGYGFITFADQTAAGTPTVGRIVYLTTPLHSFTAGAFIGDGTDWLPLGAREVANSTFSTQITSAGNTETIGYSLNADLITGRKYRLRAHLTVQAGVNNEIGIARLRADTGAITTSSTTVSTARITNVIAGGAGAETIEFSGTFIAPSTSTFHFGVGVATLSGGSNTTVVGNVAEPSELWLDFVK